MLVFCFWRQIDIQLTNILIVRVCTENRHISIANGSQSSSQSVEFLLSNVPVLHVLLLLARRLCN